MDLNYNSIPPKVDEFEISVFGPGYGESILIHAGDNDWIIIDSCIDITNSTPATLVYLKKSGIDVSSSVRLIVATHWHDDHIRGLSQIVNECASASFVLSDALNSNEFFNVLSAYNDVPLLQDTSGIKELYYSLKILKAREKEYPTNFIHPTFAAVNKCLWRRTYPKSVDKASCVITALSPSSASIIASKLEISKWIPEIHKTKKRIAPLEPNHTSIVLLVTLGDKHILLGSDLEQTSDQNFGWSAILFDPNLPKNKSLVFKIPHHGSITAHNPEIWTEMLEPNPISILTPFIRANQELPTTDDVNRIMSLTSNAFSTAMRTVKRSPRRQNIVEKQIKETTLNFRQIYPQMGQVTLRSKYGTKDFQVSLSGNAIPLKNYYQ